MPYARENFPAKTKPNSSKQNFQDRRAFRGTEIKKNHAAERREI